MTNALQRLWHMNVTTYALVLCVYGAYGTWVLVTGHPVWGEVGCGWDGAQYCRMFFGEDAVEPYRRRLAPIIVARLISPDPLRAFLVMNSLAMIVVALISTYLIICYVRAEGVARITAVGFAAVVATSRNTIHHFVNAPVLTDFVGLAAVFVFFFGVHALSLRSRSKRALGLIAVTIGGVTGGFSREQLAVGFAVALTPLILNRTTRKLGIGGLAAVAVAPVVLLGYSSAGSSASVMSQWFSDYTKSWESVSIFLGMVALAIWTWPLLIGINLRWPSRSTTWKSLILFAFATFFVSLFSGGNLDRILLPVGTVLALAAAMTVDTPRRRDAFLLTVGGYVVAQYPFFVMAPGARNFLGFIDFWHSATYEEFLVFGIGGLLAGAPFAIAGLWLAFSERFRPPLVRKGIPSDDHA